MEKQKFVKEKHQARKNYGLIENQLYRNGTIDNPKPRIVACDYDAYRHIERIHVELGHPGAEKTFFEVNRQTFGISMEDIRWLKKRCLICAVNQPNNTRPPLEPMVVLKALERIQVDLIDMRHEPSGAYK